MKIVLLGHPGAGKGTQGAHLSKVYGIPQISTGDILRKAVADGTVLGKKIHAVIREGKLVPDDLIISIIEERISQEDCLPGFILDGFPRTIEQAVAIEELLPGGMDVTVHLDVPRSETVGRLSGRLTCKSCGAVYRKQDMTLCPACAGHLYQREDDLKSTIEHRIRVYLEHTAPLVGFYRELGKLADVDGTGDPEEIYDRVDAEILQVVPK